MHSTRFLRLPIIVAFLLVGAWLIFSKGVEAQSPSVSVGDGPALEHHVDQAGIDRGTIKFKSFSRWERVSSPQGGIALTAGAVRQPLETGPRQSETH